MSGVSAKILAARMLGGALMVVMRPLAASATWAGQKHEYIEVVRRSFTDPDFLYDVALSHPFLLFLVASVAVLCVATVIFCGLAVKYRRRNNRMAARWARMEAEWEPFIISVLNGQKPSGWIRAHVQDEDQLFFIDYLTRFAIRFQGPEQVRISELAHPFVPAVAAHLKSRHAAERARAVQALGQLAFTEYSSQIVDALDDKSPLVAMVAARTLSRKEHPEFVEPVIRRMYRFHQWSPKFLSTMLSAIGPKASPLLREAYADRLKDSQVRAIAADALRELNDFHAAEIAAVVLADEKEIEEIAESERRHAAAEVARTAENDEARLEQFDPGGGPPRSSEPADRDRYEGRPHVHRDLIASSLRLIRSKGREEHAGVVRYFCGSPDFVLRECAYHALGRVGKEEDLERLQAALDEESVWVALHAARALRELGSDTKLRELVANSHPHAKVARQVLAEAIQ